MGKSIKFIAYENRSQGKKIFLNFVFRKIFESHDFSTIPILIDC